MQITKKNHNGFTLIEVIISLAMLAMMIIPALSIYANVTRVNTQAQVNQKAVNLGQNLLEALETKDAEELGQIFGGVKPFQLLNSNLSGFTNAYQLKAYSEGGYGENSSDPKNPQFYIQGISDGDMPFDVVITINSDTYRDTIKYPNNMNNYQMPELGEFNQNRVTFIDPEGITAEWSDASVTASCDNSKSTDNQVLVDLYNIQSSYLVYLEGDTSVTPIIYTLDQMKAAIVKNLSLSFQKAISDSTVRINCTVQYTCNLDLNGDGFSETVSYNLYDVNTLATGEDGFDRNICLLYTPSPYKDKISICNDGAKVKLMIAKQEGTTGTAVIINKSELNSADTEIDTNLTVGELDTGSVPNISEHCLITQKLAADRIGHVEVSVYKAGVIASGDFSEPYAVYNSTLILR